MDYKEVSKNMEKIIGEICLTVIICCFLICNSFGD